MSSNITAIPHEDSGKVQKTSGDSALTVSMGKSPEKLPEEIMERIISRIPFPSLFKVKLLSKIWYFKFPHASQLTESPLPLISLQNRVSSISFKWPTYCPIYLSHTAVIGFDRTEARWQTMMDISYLPVSAWSIVTCSGPLICVMKWDNSQDVFVTNTITRGYRKLNFQLYGGAPTVLKIIMQGSHAYQVLMVSRDEEEFCSHVYDSSRRNYKRNTLGPACHTLRPGPHSHIYPATAYLEGNLYCISSYWGSRTVSLWMCNVKNNVWSTIPHCPANVFDNIIDCGVMLCGDKVMVTLCTKREEDEGIHGLYLNITENSIHICELDVVTLQLKPVSLGPPELICGVGAQDGAVCGTLEGQKVMLIDPGKGRMHFASDSECIYFGQIFPGITILSYKIQSDEWECLPPANCPLPARYNFTAGDARWTTGPFQPGLCPFIMV